MIIINEETHSPCPVCLAVLDAKIIEDEGKVYVFKSCSLHGRFKCLVEPDAAFYRHSMLSRGKAGRASSMFNHLTIPITSKNDTGSDTPFFSPDMPLDKINDVIKRSSAALILLGGGEPTIRKDLPEIIAMVANAGRVAGILTDGTKLADKDYLIELKKSGLGLIDLSFVSGKIKDKHYIKTKERVFKNIAPFRENIRLILSLFLEKGIDRKEFHNLIHTCLKHIRSISQVNLRDAREIQGTAGSGIYVSDMLQLLADYLEAPKQDLISMSRSCDYGCCNASLELFAHRMLSREKRDHSPSVFLSLRCRPTRYNLDLGEVEKCLHTRSTRDGSILPFCQCEKAVAAEKSIKDINLDTGVGRWWPRFQERLQVMEIVATNLCNFRCGMCDAWKSPAHGLPTNLIKKILAQGRQLGGQELRIVGGEPLMRKDMLEILEYAKQTVEWPTVLLLSNGSTINDETAKRLSCCVDYTIISIEATRQCHEAIRGEGTYDKAVSAVRLLRKYGIKTGLAMVVSRQSYRYLKSLVYLAKELDVAQISFQPFQKMYLSCRTENHEKYVIPETEIRALSEAIDEVILCAHDNHVDIFSINALRMMPAYFMHHESIKPHDGCNVPFYGFTIGVTGEVTPCFYWDFVVGNVKREDIAAIWNSDKYKLARETAKNKKCPGCLAACSDLESYRAQDYDFPR